MPTTTGTKMAEILSASWPISGLLLCAWRTMRIIRDSVVWLPTALAVNSTLPSCTTVPACTASPSDFCWG
jgi:hypothetical protein